MCVAVPRTVFFLLRLLAHQKQVIIKYDPLHDEDSQEKPDQA